jgi:hypothetical protein
MVSLAPMGMGMGELEAAWEEHRSQIREDYQEWDEQRLATIDEHLEPMNSFLSGQSTLGSFRTRIDSLTKSTPLWGFRGTSQMFFNQLVNAAEPQALEATLKQVLPVPSGAEEAKAKLEAFQAAVEAARDRAEEIGATQPGIGRIDAFASFFWELQDRDAWPTFFPNSRNVLERYGLLDVNQRQSDLYLDYRSRIEDLKAALETDTWGVEHLLWYLGQGAAKDEVEQAAGAEPLPSVEPVTDLYASYRQQKLHFPVVIVTSLVLSLATKRLVILSGISGTGKTKIALGLARYLDSLVESEDEQPETEAPVQDPGNLYIRLTAPKLQRGLASLVHEAQTYVDAGPGLPARGHSRLYKTRLPDGQVHEMRLNNVDFSVASRNLYRLYFRKEITDWLQENAKPNDFLHLAIKPDEGIDFGLDVVDSGKSTGGGERLKRYATIAVRSEWTDPRGLIGYFNPLTSAYERTGLVELLLRAGDDPEHPYVVILDEMNLARVEYYFSDFLSALESDEALTLMSPGAADENAAQENSDVEIPAELAVPPNVSFVGTVNVDETTHPFSPKVLDRANVIEFSDVDVERALGHGDTSAGGGLRLKGGVFEEGWLCASKADSIAPKAIANELEQFTEALEDIHGILAWSNLQFGYRVIDEISAFVGHAVEKAEGDQDEVVRGAFDLQVKQKVVPKLSGGRELEEPLARLLRYCLDGTKARSVTVDQVRASARARLESKEGQPARYPESARKLLRMLDRLADTGFIGALE